MDFTSPLRAGASAQAAYDALRAKINPEYREIVDGAVALLEEYRLRAQTEPSAANDARAARRLSISDQLWQGWRSIWTDAAECLAEAAHDVEQVAAAKGYTEAHLTRRLLDAPLWRQAYTKPLGYAGDYTVMNYIYNGSAQGDTPFARLAHSLAVHIGEFVVRRKDLVRESIATVLAHEGGSRNVTIASLGCGPAHEVAELTANGLRRAAPATFVLVDQDEHALRFAGHSIAGALARHRDAPAVRVDLRKVSVLRLLRDFHPRDVLSDADMIYSAGLFDHFTDRTCRILTRRLYEALRPGGMLLLGNMKAGTDMRWPLDFIADWTLTYRSAECVMSWAEGLPGAEISLRTEATGYDYLLTVRKPS